MKKPNDHLEHRIHRVLTSLPDRQAPNSLESRVMAEIARRAALPWWKQSFARWPQGARLVFLVTTAVVAAAMIYLAAYLFSLTPSQAADGESTSALSMLLGSLWDYGRNFLANLPPHALTIGVAVIGASYAALFGLGAAAYRYVFKNN